MADVATSRKRVELQANQLNAEVDKMSVAAKRALEQGREDLAREALTRKSALQQQLADLQAQHAQLAGEEEKLVRASQRLQAKVDAFRTKKETIKATYSAAEAQTRVNEAFSGLGEEMGDVGLAIQRAEDRTQQMQARAGAVDELLASGALDDPSGLAKDDITRELDSLASSSQVENELEAMKRSLGQLDAGAAEPTPELSAGRATQQPGAVASAQPQNGQAQQVGPVQPPTYQQPPAQGEASSEPTREG